MAQNNDVPNLFYTYDDYQPNNDLFDQPVTPPQWSPDHQVLHFHQEQPARQMLVENDEASGVGSSDPEELDEKMTKREKNRLAAVACRERKKQYVNLLEETVLKKEVQLKQYEQLIADLIRVHPTSQSIVDEHKKEWKRKLNKQKLSIH